MKGFERILGTVHVATLEKVQNVSNLLFMQGKTEEKRSKVIVFTSIERFSEKSRLESPYFS